MSISGWGNSLLSLGSQYNFKKMTNEQFSTAVTELGKEGKISQTDADQLSFIAQGVDYCPISGPKPSVAQTLADPTDHDFISELEGDDNSANMPGMKGGALVDDMLKALRTYQYDTAENAAQTPSLKV